MMEAMLLYQEGVMPELIDKVAVEFGMPMGPVELADTVGLDICLHVARNLGDKVNIAIPDKLVKMVESGTLGRKTGAGFYQYKNGKPLKNNTVAGMPHTDIEDRLILRIVNECAACLRDDIVGDADLLDAGMIFGTGFAPFRGGPMHYAQARGYPAIVARLVTLSEQHGERFTPDPYWQSLIS
jgi:3-hydroxyacyl-CoA dehydrogenase/enoyl-CoA hydratase/3-hydroxybutyryl-CoA epimerase